MIYTPTSTRLVCYALVAALFTSQIAQAARLGAIKTIPTTYDASKLIVFNEQPTPVKESNEDTLPKLISLASLRLDATYTAWAQSSAIPMARQFPETTNADNGLWQTDSIETPTGSPGLLATSLWDMHKLTFSATWMDRAMEASVIVASSPTLSDASMGQSIALLTYPTLKLAYESALGSEKHAESAKLFLKAALTAASTLSRMYVRIPGVIKVRPTADIAAEAAKAGVASISPFAVFSTVEGSAAATGLLAWASTLPGGKQVWLDIAVRNAKRIAQDHISNDGTVQGAMVYSSLSSTTAPKPLSASGISSLTAKSVYSSSLESASEAIEAAATFVQEVMGTLNGHPSPAHAAAPASSTTSSSSSTVSAGDAMDSWLSSIGGQATNEGLRQALGTMTMIEAARATAEDAELSSFFVKAAEASALSLLASSSPSSSASFDPLSASAAAAALSELSSLQVLSFERSTEYSDAAKNILIQLYPVASGSKKTDSFESEIDESLGAVASKWLSNLLKASATSPQSILLPAVGEEAESDDQAILNEEVKGITQEDIDVISSEEIIAENKVSVYAAKAILPNGSMLGDQMLLQALVVLLR